MKKIFGIFIFVIAVSCVADCFAAVGAKCSYRTSDDMVDGQSKGVPCRDLNIQNAVDCFVYCANGTVKQGVRRCTNDSFTVNPVSGVAGMYEKCGTKEEACESFDSKNSGAKWDNTIHDCVCDGNSQTWNKITMLCEDSDEYKKCDASDDAQWDPQGGFCWCTNLNELWFNGACRTRREKKICDDIKGKLKSPYEDSIRWNETGQQCECVAGKIAADGEEIVNPDNYYIGYIWNYVYVDADGTKQTKRIDGTVCYLNGKTKYNRDSKRTADSPQTAQTRKNIEAKYNALATISGAWGKSHWKTASGNFNGARLASDSVAGVVLGTVGGVITSNVIKKNQVRGGFEDINCTIGGQRVAGYDDQFVVGIQ